MRLLILLSNVILISTSAMEEVTKEKQRLLDQELTNMLGNDIKLSETELKVNKIFMDLKIDKLEHAFKNPEDFTFYKHFFDWKDRVTDCKLFQLIKKMPKGAILHAHDTGLLNADYMLSLTYWDNLYVDMNKGVVEDFRFSKTVPNNDQPPKPASNTCPCHDPGNDTSHWQLMKDARNASGDVKKFDAELKKRFGMVVENHDAVYPNITAAWYTFQDIFIYTSNLVQYKPVWAKYFYDTLTALRNDGVMYMEIRSILPPLYDLDGNTYDAVETAVTYKEVVDKFKIDFPDFFGAKLIYAPLRMATPENVQEYLKIARKIKQRLPDFFAGFDLVGQEDLGQPLKAFLPELVEARAEFDLFLHAGETNWNGLSSDDNLYDAIALGAKRIGHGYSMIKHPVLMEEVKKRDIGIEVNVISNMVLKLVADVRNHPVATWLVSGMPVLLSSDDPGLWGAQPMSHDFYVVFAGVSNRHADLRMLKKLALNSLAYSTYPKKEEMIKEFENRWSKFIDGILCDQLCCGPKQE